MIKLSEWVKTCSVDELDGSLYSFDHNEKRILLSKIGGQVYATDRMCTHEDADLSCGFATPEGIRCNLHLSVFDMRDGKPQNPPAKKPLATYNVKIDDKDVYVEL
ncbi:MAG: Naphthalene 12-dioxygenase system ferredoxin subunit protein [Cenarchaeum symbiont of Oopsacas minuta]|nr:Naphthalene 12-dioxygenase system ferredoxin subunit protein [Cenarchaeum symbiont of Oopsacas minuta]